jgi:predicted RecA/RadA family phage recombinase
MATPQCRFVQGDPLMIPYTNSAAVVGGDVVIVNDRTLISHMDFAANALGGYGWDGGEYAAAAASGTTFAIGDTVWWDDTANQAVASATNNAMLGIVTRAKASGELVVYFEHLQNAPVV